MAIEKNFGLSTLQGAFERYDNSLADVAKSGDYNDLLNLPSSGGGASDYAELTGAPFARTDVPAALLDETLTSGDSYKRIQNPVLCKRIVDSFLKEYPDEISYSDKQVFDDPSIEVLVYGDGTLIENTHLTIYTTNFDSFSFPDPETAETITVKTGTYHLTVENDAYDPNTSGSVPNYGHISFEFTIYDIVPQHNQYSITIWPNFGHLDTERIVINGIDYEFSLDQHSKINNIGYDNLNDAPIKKSYIVGGTPESVTLTSADQTELGPGVYTWEKDIPSTLCDNLTAAIEASSSLSPLPTDYSQAVEVPNSIMKVDVYINGSTSPTLNITPYVFADTPNNQGTALVIVFKYQNSYPIGSLHLGRKTAGFNLDYQDSEVLGTVTSIKYEITGSIVSWIARNNGDVFDIDISELATVATSGDYNDLINKPEIVVVNGSKKCNRVNNASGDYNFNIDVPEGLNPNDYTVISIMQQIGGWVASGRNAWTNVLRETTAGDSTPNIDWMYDETENKWVVQLNIYNNSSQAVTLKYHVVFMKIS